MNAKKIWIILWAAISLTTPSVLAANAARESACPDADPEELIRVIVMLADQPHRALAREIRARHAAERGSIERNIRAVNGRYSRERLVDTGRDADNYDRPDLRLTDSERAVLREQLERLDEFDHRIVSELSAAVADAIAPTQDEVSAFVAGLGGQVEKRLVTVNALIVLLPAGSVGLLVAHRQVAEVAEDGLLSAHVDNADSAILVSGPGGLWSSHYFGGIWDLAVIDSGADLSHPALEDRTLRTNYYGLALDSAFASPFWDDSLDVDDRNGHGTNVTGIVGSLGSEGFSYHLGIAFGVQKLVTLKAAFQDTDGKASMFHSDAMAAVDLALSRSADLLPAGFSDEVDAINLSYGAPVATDDSLYMQFWDSVVSTWGRPVTLSVGNTGPVNTDFQDPAGAYNALTVANVVDSNTPLRLDDVIFTTSTRGPTAGGRRKPDISAPGTGITAPAYNWEGANPDFSRWTGTSQAAPMVLGAIGTLMDAGVTDHLSLRALLLNTAQKNELLINFEDDTDGWDPAYGWGYMNLLAAFHHRTDIFRHCVTESGTPGEYRLYRGQMQDEGSSGEGRDRATLVWDRVVEYIPGSYPMDSHSPARLSLWIFAEEDGTVVDSDDNLVDNVRQVRVDAGEGPATDVVLRVKAMNLNFPHGEETQEYALATEEGFSETSFPSSFQAYLGNYPHQVGPGETFTIFFQVENQSELPSHLNQFSLILPEGWVLLSGDNPFQAGSTPGGNSMSSPVVWTVQAQTTVAQHVELTVQHLHISYGDIFNQFWPLFIDVVDSIFSDGFESGNTTGWSN